MLQTAGCDLSKCKPMSCALLQVSLMDSPYVVKEEEENSMHNTVVLFSASDSFTLKQVSLWSQNRSELKAKGNIFAFSLSGFVFFVTYSSLKKNLHTYQHHRALRLHICSSVLHGDNTWHMILLLNICALDDFYISMGVRKNFTGGYLISLVSPGHVCGVWELWSGCWGQTASLLPVRPVLPPLLRQY